MTREELKEVCDKTIFSLGVTKKLHNRFWKFIDQYGDFELVKKSCTQCKGREVITRQLGEQE